VEGEELKQKSLCKDKALFSVRLFVFQVSKGSFSRLVLAVSYLRLQHITAFSPFKNP
jgi:hypothetical protein